jgi:hypothetical protein
MISASQSWSFLDDVRWSVRIASARALILSLTISAAASVSAFFLIDSRNANVAEVCWLVDCDDDMIGEPSQELQLIIITGIRLKGSLSAEGYLNSGCIWSRGRITPRWRNIESRVGCETVRNGSPAIAAPEIA